jgi:DNA helicase-2/ATP-dependent DNA helicase PcrA
MFGMFPDILAKWQRRFNFIHVDEFQDIDRVQYKLIKQLAGKENQVYVVGDPDQTIYTWRGADVNIIMEFEKDFKPSETVILNQNYRSTQHILNGANSLIKNNQYRVDKDLFTELVSDEKVTHCAFISEDHEANWIADKLKEMNEKGKLYKDMAILYRSNYLSRSMEKAFLDHHIPYVIYGGTRFYDRAEIKDMLSYLRMLTHGDDLAFMRVINTPKRGLGTKTLDKLREDAKANKRTLYEQIKTENNFSGKTYDAFDRFVRLVESTKLLMGQKPLLEILEKMENDSGLRAMYEAAHEVDRLENIKELINDVITFQNQYPESGLDEYLQMVALYGDRNDLTDGDYCQMMTIHAAKGLEFDTVFVIGLSEGIFPNERAMSEGRRGLEEERRLAYVAYTRAKNKLFLTEVSGYSFVLTKIRSRSRFIEEVDQKHIDHIGVNYDFEKPKEINLKSKPKEQSLFADSMEKRKALPYKKGELIMHSTFGEGVILKIDGGMAEIAFDYPNGVKKIMLAAPAISKVKREES